MKRTIVAATLIVASCALANNAAVTDVAPAKAECTQCCKHKKPDAKKYIGEEAAIKAALDHAKLERAKVRDLKCELDRENGIMVYEVEFESGLFDYEYDIDAFTGKILKSKKEFD